MSRVCAVLVLGLTACGGGFKLDPFLYAPGRVDHYEYPATGSDAAETIDPAQIHPQTITTEDGLTLGAVYVESPVSPPLGYVIFFHGKGGNLDETMPRLNRLANMGYSTLGFDYRGWGISTDVAPSEEGIDRDGRAVVAFMRTLVPAGFEDQLIYAGQSFGTATATQRAATQPPIALILESGFASIAKFEQESTRMDLPQSFISTDSWDTEARLTRIHVPVMFMHGTDDDVIRPTHTEANFAAANPYKEKWIIEGASHSDIPQVWGEDVYAEHVRAFLRDHALPQQP